MSASPVILASQSPRRRSLLEAAGLDVDVHPPDIDDGTLHPGPVTPEAWVMALAWLKARRVAELLGFPNRTVLGADTVCVHHDRIIGQPSDRSHARAMIDAMQEATHRTISGVCLYDPSRARRMLFVDAARVEVGRIPSDSVEGYLASDEWRGKAGAYNLADRQAAGWPIVCEGDPGTVMGLPMQRLIPLLDRWCGADDPSREEPAA